MTKKKATFEESLDAFSDTMEVSTGVLEQFSREHNLQSSPTADQQPKEQPDEQSAGEDPSTKGLASEILKLRVQTQKLETELTILKGTVSTVREELNEKTRLATYILGAASGMILMIVILLIILWASIPEGAGEYSPPKSPTDQQASEPKDGSIDTAATKPSDSTAETPAAYQQGSAADAAIKESARKDSQEASAAERSQRRPDEPRPDRLSDEASQASADTNPSIPAESDLRQRFSTLLAQKKMSDAIDVGLLLEKNYSLNADGSFALANAHRLVGRNHEALPRFDAFIKEHPQHEYTDDALFWAAEILVGMGKRKMAKSYYKKILSMRDSNFRTSARRRLRALR